MEKDNGQLIVEEKSSFESKKMAEALPVLSEQLPGSDGQLSLAAQLKEKEEELSEAHETIARDEKIIQYWEGTYIYFLRNYKTAW
jgi:hypothetical protein